MLWLLETLLGRRFDQEARQHLSALATHRQQQARGRATTLLASLAAEPGPGVDLGETPWGAPVRVPLRLLVEAHAVLTGGTGSGKTMAALALVDTLLDPRVRDLSFGVLDAKGELFERTLFLVAMKLRSLAPEAADALRRRLVIVDLASRDPITSYNIAAPWSGGDLDFFATSRVETLEELLPSGNGFSLRGAALAKHVLKLLADRALPFSYFDRVLASEPFRARLLGDTRNEEIRYYFEHHFPTEGRAAVAAVRARIASTLLGSESLKLALSGLDAPDLRRLQDEGRIVLINCAGPNIARATARTLQALFLSDIRQAVFARTNHNPFLWLCDEAQNFFRTRYLRENMTELLTMSRSFGSFFLYLTQNLSTAVQDGEMLETLYTNIRWSLTLRSTARDGAFLAPALPVTGRMQKPWHDPYAPTEFYEPTEERQMLLAGLAHLPDRTGWLWLKAQTPEAVQVRTRTIAIPEGAAYRREVSRLRDDAGIGERRGRDAYLAEIARREAAMHAAPSQADALRAAFRDEQERGG